jgi:ribosomal protein S18 acetylase RimI-like enzyme
MAEQQELSIRPAAPGDSPALMALSERLAIGVAPWRDPVRVAAAARGWIGSSLAAAGQDGRAVLVARCGDQIAGLVSLAERSHFTGQTDAYIGELVVDARLEGRGVGQALLAAAEGWAAGRGLSYITLETGTGNDRARHFYECAGYKEEEIRLTKPVRAQP